MTTDRDRDAFEKEAKRWGMDLTRDRICHGDYDYSTVNTAWRFWCDGFAHARKAGAQEPAALNRIWFDTEFIEDGQTIDLLSIGLVREDGSTYYAEPKEADRSRASEWVKENVIPHLHGPVKPRAVIAREIVEFVGKDPEFWAYYADYDWVALCQLFGTMMDLPRGWPMFCRDVQQVRATFGVKKLPPQSSTEHHALSDAIWTKEAHAYLSSIYTPAASAQEPVAVPAGWKLVPVEPTWEMQIAGRDAILSKDPYIDLSSDDAREAYHWRPIPAPVSPPAESGEVERMREAQAPQPGGAVKATVGYSLVNEWWWVRIYPCTSEQDARRLGRRILSALEPSPSGWDAGAEAERKTWIDTADTLIESLQEGIMTDAGIKESDREKMRAQIDALDVLKRERDGTPLPTPAGEGQ